MWIQCQILLKLASSEDKIYRSGEIVSGVLKYNLNEDTVFESIILQLEGEGKCSWTEATRDDTPNSCDKRQYVQVQKHILENGKHRIAAGTYNHDFEFLLPPLLPSVLNDKAGRITYIVKAMFNKHSYGLFSNTKKFECKIPVYGSLEPYLVQAVIFCLTKNPNSLTSTGSVEVKIKVQKTFLEAGESIELTYTIINNADIEVSAIKMQLFTEVTYMNHDKNIQRKVVPGCGIETLGVAAKSVLSKQCTVPTTLDLYSIDNSNIVKREYKLHVTAVLPFPHRNVSAEIPVVISKKPKPKSEK